MRLAAFKAQGFKSFIHPISFKVDGELTGIVGPNGCGKSNIVDAVRWVLGESRASSLRGSTLADVLFNGSQQHQPADWCHVELHFINEGKNQNNSMWAAYPEITVRRELSRDGRQSYTINDITVRRRDVVDLFRGTGVAPRAYGVIEQGMVTDIAEASPEELRAFMEEAAGISHYKERRRDSERRLDAGGENLAQVALMLDGYRKRADALKRQARAARRYRELGEEINRLDALLILSRRNIAEATLADKRSRLKEQEEKIQQLHIRLAELKKQSADKKQKYDTMQTQVDAAMAQLSEAQKVLTKAEQNIHHAVQNTDTARTRLQEAQHELSALNEQAQQLSRDEDNLNSARTRLLAQIEQNSGAAEAEVQELARLQINREKAQATADAAREHLTATRQQLEADSVRRQMVAQQLADINKRLAAAQSARDALPPQEQIDDGLDEQERQVAAGERALAAAQARQTQLRAAVDEADAALRQLENDKATRHAEINTLNAMLREDNWPDSEQRLAHVLQINAGEWANALDAALGVYAAAVTVENIDTFISANGLPPPGAAVIEIHPADAPRDDNNTGLPSLLSLLQVPEKQRGILHYWLAGVYAAADEHIAAAARTQLARNECIVTPGGAIYGRHSLLVSGEMRGGYNWEQRKQQALAALQTLENTHTAQKAIYSEADAAANKQQDAIQQLTQELQQLQNTLFDRRLELNSRLERRQAAAARAEELAQLMRALHEEQQRLQDEHSGADDNIARLNEEHHTREAQFNREKSIMDDAGGALESYRQVMQDAGLKRHSMERNLDEIKRQQDDLAARKRENSEQRQLITRRVNDFKNEIKQHDEDTLKQALTTYRQQFAACEELVAARRRQQRDIEDALTQAQTQREDLRADLDRRQQQLAEARLQEHDSALRLGALSDALDELELSPQQLEALSAEREDSAEQRQQMIDQLRGKRERLGAINFMAENELHDYEVKINELNAQKEDIESAIEELRSTIRRIDHETKSRMQSTYDAVNQEFPRLYRRIFDGGDARLDMLGETILDAGFELKVRPPGKRLFPMRMLSGGEKAAAAAAFIFSILHLNPPPFCILDEVDAPLDDHRTRRFVELLQDISRTVQCLVITHNKNTISSLPRLIGVTQEEPGASKIVSVTLNDALRAAGK